MELRRSVASDAAEVAVRRAFASADVDSSGQCIVALCRRAPALTTRRLAPPNLLHLPTGALSPDEFRSLCAAMGMASDQDVAQLFWALDSDGDGSIALSELYEHFAASVELPSSATSAAQGGEARR